MYGKTGLNTGVSKSSNLNYAHRTKIPIKKSVIMYELRLLSIYI